MLDYEVSTKVMPSRRRRSSYGSLRKPFASLVAALKQLGLFSLIHQRIRGDLISMFKIAHCFLVISMVSIFTQPYRMGIRSHAYEFHHQRRFIRRLQYSFSTTPAPYWNNLPSEIVNASPAKSFKTLLDAN